MFFFVFFFCKWLFSFSLSSGYINVTGFPSFLRLKNTPLCFLYHILFVYSYVDAHLRCFHLLVIVNSAAMNKGVQIFLQDLVFNSFRHMFRSAIAGLDENSIIFFKEPPFHLSHSVIKTILFKLLLTMSKINFVTEICAYM